MTARPAAPELTEAEQRFLDRPDAPEGLEATDYELGPEVEDPNLRAG